MNSDDEDAVPPPPPYELHAAGHAGCESALFDSRWIDASLTHDVEECARLCVHVCVLSGLMSAFSEYADAPPPPPPESLDPPESFLSHAAASESPRWTSELTDGPVISEENEEAPEPPGTHEDEEAAPTDAQFMGRTRSGSGVGVGVAAIPAIPPRPTPVHADAERSSPPPPSQQHAGSSNAASSSAFSPTPSSPGASPLNFGQLAQSPSSSSTPLALSPTSSFSGGLRSGSYPPPLPASFSTVPASAVASPASASASAASSPSGVSALGTRLNRAQTEPEDFDSSPAATAASLLTSAQDLGSSKSFASSLTHNFPGVASQVEIGSYATKRSATFLKKLALAQEEYGRHISKLLAHEQTKLPKLSNDGMRVSTKTWAAFLELYGKLARSHLAESAEILTHAATPLHDSHLALEERRKEILVEERKSSLEMVKAREEVSKSLAHTVKLLDEARAATAGESNSAAHKKSTAASAASGFFKTLAAAVGKKPEVLIKEASKAAEAYKLSIGLANKRQTKYIESDMPKLFNEMQLMERKRMDVAKARLAKFHQISLQHAQERKDTMDMIRTTIEQMDAKQDIAQFIQDLLWEHGVPIAPRPFSYDLPCTPSDIDAGRLEGNPNSIFRSTLAHCMKLQQDSPDASARSLDVPRILPALIGRIRELGGAKELGIFRISVAKDDLDALRNQIDGGNYNLSNVKNAHQCAALLKDWIRLLLEPLVPTEQFYAQAIESVKGAPKTADGAAAGAPVDAAAAQSAAVQRLFDALPPLNQRVLRHLSSLVRELSEPENSAVSKMTVDNLAIVFAPSFLRNPSEDPSVLLSNSKYEVKWTVQLFKTLGNITW